MLLRVIEPTPKTHHLGVNARAYSFGQRYKRRDMMLIYLVNAKDRKTEDMDSIAGSSRGRKEEEVGPSPPRAKDSMRKQEKEAKGI